MKQFSFIRNVLISPEKQILIIYTGYKKGKVQYMQMTPIDDKRTTEVK